MGRVPARYLGLDVLRALAAFTVVLIHTPAHPNTFFKSLLLNLLPPANAVFAMMAGFFLVKKLKTEVVFFAWLKVRAKRLGAPYLFWVLIYLLLNAGFDLLRGNAPSGNFASLKYWRGVLFCGSGSVQLWFVVTLLYSQIMLFGLWRYVRRALDEKSTLVLLTCIGFIMVIVYPYIRNELYMRRLAFILGYLFLGALIERLEVLLEKNRRNIFWCGAIFLAVSFGATLYHFELPYNLRVMVTVIWVVIARCAMPLRVPDFVLSMGRYSMFIYLVHIVFTTLIPLALHAVGMADSAGWSFICVTVVAFILSWYSAVLIAKFNRIEFFKKHIAYWIGV